MRTTPRYSLLCGLLAIATSGATAAPRAMAGGGKGGPLLPPNAHFRGQSLEGWSVLWVEWFIDNHFGPGLGIPDTVDKMRLLPAENVPGDYAYGINVRQGTGLVLPAMFIFGELYADGSVDDPNFVFPDEPWAVDPNLGSLAGITLVDYLYMTARTEVELDGDVLLSGVASDLDDYQFGPTYFDGPIFYAETQPNDAVAALWTIGVGAVYTPLSKGAHTMEVTTVLENIFFGHAEFHYTYHITVSH
jgi:hypothetical protein